MLTKEFESELKKWRHDFHASPELNFDVNQTAAKVAELLKSFGLEVHTGIGGTGVVGVLKKGTGNKSIGIRADMDALPITEPNDFPYKSKNPGKMHACGHDGHTTMALGAAKYLSENGDFNGTAHFIFQPDEEATEGAQAMINDGLFEKFNIDEVYAFHNLPGLETGNFASRAGAITGSESLFEIKLHGRGGHSALPHMGVDTITVGTQIITALQSIVARKINPALNGVVSVTEFISDGKKNVLPGESVITGDTRALSLEANKIIEDSMRQIVDGIAKAHNIDYSFSYNVQTQMTINTPEQVHAAIDAAKSLVGNDLVDGYCEPKLFSEDFAQMLLVKPGCYILIGNGTEGNNGKSLHSADYDFNDDLLVVGSSYWATLVTKQLD